MRTARPGEVNYDPVDRFTFAHVGVGAAYRLLGMPFWGAALLGIGWELLERPLRVRGVLRKLKPDAYRYQDTAENALVDALAVMGGWWLAGALKTDALDGYVLDPTTGETQYWDGVSPPPGAGDAPIRVFSDGSEAWAGGWIRTGSGDWAMV